jgi:ATP-dependent DNA helicase RecG
VDELGSGVRNITKYNKIYSGAEPTFIEGDVFKTIIPLVSKSEEQAT